MSAHFFDAYELLDVSYQATDLQIKKAYKKKALAYHPDKHENSTPSNQLFKLITRAKDILLDPITRLEHDYAIGIKQRSTHKEEPEVIYVNEGTNETDWGSIVGAGLVGLAIGVAIKRRKTRKKKRK